MMEVSADIIAKYERIGGEKDLNDFAKSFLPSIESKDEQIAMICEHMKVRMQLEKHFPENLRLQEFYLLVAYSLWNSCELLHIPIPRLELKQQWRSSRVKVHEEGSANAEDYVIKLHPTFIENMLEDSFGPVYQYDLMAIIYHEVYHLWQAIHFPTRYVGWKERMQKIKKENPTLVEEIKNIGRNELATLLFEHKMIGEISPDAHKKFLVKMFLILLKKWEIFRVIQLRKNRREFLEGAQ